ncbi:hypothetical protein QS795_005845 [Providencia zhijiangensis]|uniref:LRAT domain-containing protein n=1 Tax=Providencia zhijiangensis TaxID=3053982 RepID=A0ABZ0N6A8_9GAMM|nr:hypothetical protein [Providencia sp. D4759]WPA93291.1 hypothetical protein QS795_005845 [Providencia sp. D4759]
MTITTYYDDKSRLSFTRNFLKDEVDLVPGCPVVVKLALIVEHSGIYVGDDKVIELYGDGTINLVSTKKFLFGAYKQDIPLRTGINIYTPCFDGEVIYFKDAVSRALEIHNQTIEYHIRKNNCHMMTGYCLDGINFQKNTDCNTFASLTKKIMDLKLSTINASKKSGFWHKLSNSINEIRTSQFPKDVYYCGDFALNDINRFSWQPAKCNE